MARYIDAEKILKKVEKLLNKGVYKTMILELINNAPTENVIPIPECYEEFEEIIRDFASALCVSGCNDYICKFCTGSKCEKCFALADGTMRKFEWNGKKNFWEEDECTS